MTQHEVTSPAPRRPPRAVYRVVNPIVRSVLRSPLHKAVSGRLVLLIFHGRKSGKHYSIPVGYAQADERTLLVGTEGRWWKNFRDGARVEVRLRGERFTGTSDVISDKAGMREAYRTMLVVAPQYGQAIGVSLGPDDWPRPDDVSRVRQEGHVVIRITLDRSVPADTDGETETGEEVVSGVVRLSLGVVNAYLIGEPGGHWILVDAGTSGNTEKIRAVAEEWFGPETRPEAIVLTHGHADHAGSAAELADLWEVPIYTHRLELPFLTGRSAYPPPDPTVGGPFALVSRFMPNETIDLEGWVRELPPEGEVPGMEAWRWLHAPGHTPGHVALYQPEDSVLVAGDSLATMDADSFIGMLARRKKISRPATPVTPDWVAAERSVREMASLRPRVLAPGHGEPMSGPAVAGEFEAFACEFPVPESGRYVGDPARFDEHGVMSLPPAPPDPLPRMVAGVALGAALVIATVATLWRRSKGSNWKTTRRP